MWLGRDGQIRTLQTVSLADVEVGERATVLRVSGGDPEFLRYLTRLGIRIGSKTRLLDRAPFDGPLTVRVGRRRVLLGRQAAARILVGDRPL